jgi:hypothetical protein
MKAAPSQLHFYCLATMKPKAQKMVDAFYKAIAYSL